MSKYTHLMPNGKPMKGKEHLGAVPGSTRKAEKNEKYAQDVMEMLRRAGSTIGDRAGGATDAAKRWYGGMSPEGRKALMRGLAGAAIGGGLTGGLAAMTPRDPEHKGGIMGPALMGALLGGGSAAALPYGAKLLTSGVRFQPEQGRGIGSRLLDKPVEWAMRNPATVGIAGLGGAAAFRGEGGASSKRWASGMGNKMWSGIQGAPSAFETARAYAPSYANMWKQHPGVMGRATAQGAGRAAGRAAQGAWQGFGNMPSRLKFLSLALAGSPILNKQLRGDA